HRECEILGEIIRVSNSTLDIDGRLTRIAGILADAFSTDFCALYAFHKDTHSFTLAASSQRDRRDPDPTGSSRWEGLMEKVSQSRQPSFFNGGDQEDVNLKGMMSEETAPFSFALIPIADEVLSYGILLLYYAQSRRFAEDELEFLLTVGREISGTFRNAELFSEAKRKISELTSLYESSKIVTSTIEWKDLLDLVVRTSTRVLGASGGTLRLKEGKTQKLRIEAQLGTYPQSLVSLDDELARGVLSTGQPTLIDDVNQKREGVARLSLLCVPLMSRGKAFGTLTVYDKKGGKLPENDAFSREDERLLSIMANQMANTIENASARLDATKLAEEKDRQANQLSLLYEINNALLSTMKFEQILRIILTAITMGDGMGFNRAMLFLTDERRNRLTGMMGVGPDNAEQAGKIWKNLEGKRDKLSETLSSLNPQYSPTGTLLDERVRRVNIPLDKGDCILARTVREQKPFNIDYERDGVTCQKDCEIHRDVNCALASQSDGDSRSYRFATVPLWGRESTIGVIVVDNLYNGRPITDDDIQLLTMFTRQAGLAIENCILYKYLEDAHLELKKAQETLLEREKLAALGEMAASVAHEIKNPLVSIGGYARRLHKKPDNGLHEKRYTDAIIKEVGRLEGILNDILYFSKSTKVVLERFDVNRIIEETLTEMEDEMKSQGIEVEKSLHGNLPEIPCDYQEIKQVFINLITNAREAMGGGGRLTVKTAPVSQEDRDCIAIEMRDTGGGIPSEVLHNIFNPFFTTKGWGTGLGLAICHRIVDGHGGVIEVNNDPGRGVTFTVKLPVEGGAQWPTRSEASNHTASAGKGQRE
ncbi:MAG: GAF domain-containing protein, partial [Thermodesulfobacteriota bacterium]